MGYGEYIVEFPAFLRKLGGEVPAEPFRDSFGFSQGFLIGDPVGFLENVPGINAVAGVIKSGRLNRKGGQQ